MSERETLRLVEEYVHKQIATMPKLNGRKTAKISARRKRELVKSLAKAAKRLKT